MSSAVSLPDPPTGVIRVLLIGAGGHARVVLDALAAHPGIEVVGAVSADGRSIERLGVPMIGCSDDVAELVRHHRLDGACVAIGDNATRERLTSRWTATGRPLVSAISTAAVVSPSASVGAGSVLFAGAVVNAATVLGEGVIVNTNASVDHDGVIGPYVHIAPGCAIAGDVHVGARTLIGIGARVLPGVTIGADVVVGAGAVVTTDVPDGVTVVGVPARPLTRGGTPSDATASAEDRGSHPPSVHDGSVDDTAAGQQ